MGVDRKVAESRIVTSTPSKFHQYSLQNSCNNLLCFHKYETNGDGDSACLLDIAANKFIMLPKPVKEEPTCDIRSSFYGLGFDFWRNQHKTLRIEVCLLEDNNLSNYFMKAEVNKLGENTWERVTGEVPMGSIFGKPVMIHGALVWADFPHNDVSRSTRCCATVFELDDEKFSTVRYPENINLISGHLVSLNNQLCYVDLSSDSCIHILVMRSIFGSQSWESLCRIKMRTISGEEDHRWTRVIGSLENGKILLKSYGGMYVLYEAATDRLEYVHLPVRTSTETEVHCYTGQLFPSSVEIENLIEKVGRIKI
ncbi:hypothetical protein QQ045_027268 [Rhodiola kirilowii]